MPLKTNSLFIVLAGALLLVVAAFVGLATLWNFGANQPLVVTPSATTAGVVARVEGGQVEFLVGYGKSVINLSSFAVFDDAGNLLWQFESHAQGKPEVIEYGVLPVGAPNEYVETFPTAGTKPVEIRGKDIVVKGNVRFIVPLGAGHELFEAELSIPSDSP